MTKIENSHKKKARGKAEKRRRRRKEGRVKKYIRN
jgi:hypothetical protein